MTAGYITDMSGCQYKISINITVRTSTSEETLEGEQDILTFFRQCYANIIQIVKPVN